MRVPRGFNVAPYIMPPELPDWFQQFVGRYREQMKRIAEGLSGPTVFDATAGVPLAAATTLSLKVADLVQVTLTLNTTLTIDLDQRAGAEGSVELIQDAIGGRTVAWVNVVWTNGTPPVVAAGIGKRTLVGVTCNGATWVGRILATNY